jgi:hypothetical protein
MRVSSFLAAAGLLLAGVRELAADDPASAATEAGSKPALRLAGDEGEPRVPLVRIAAEGQIVFLGAASAADGDSWVLQTSEDMVSWEADLPVLVEAAPPPPPPVALVEELIQRGGIRLRILPLRIAELGQRFFRGLVLAESAAPDPGQPIAD